jgi:serine/threonine-protein kinase
VDFDFGTLPLSLVRRVDRACDRFEAEWRAGGRPAIEPYLAEASAAEQPALLRALLAVEIEHRRARGESPTRAEYAARFPGWEGAACAAFDDQGDPRCDSTAAYVPGPAGSERRASAGSLPDRETGDGSERERERGRRRFDVLRPHAAGGLGAVFVAHDRELNREVALKAMQDQHASDPFNRRRFVFEAEVTGTLEHPGIVPVYSLGLDGDGRPYYAMRFIRGETLDEALSRYHAAESKAQAPGARGLGLRQLLTRFVAVCNAVAYAHSRGVIHRDLKPANIMLGPYGETLVVDWGLARSTGRGVGVGDGAPAPAAGLSGAAPTDDSSVTQTGTRLGTPSYMSPEQAAGRLDLIGPASDVYGLGATLYHLLTGRPPFVGRDVALVLADVEKGAFPPPRAVEPGVPRPLESICLKAMAVRPEDRYATPDPLARDIERWLADEPVSAHPEPRLARTARWLRRHKSWALAGAVTLVLTAAVSALAALNVARAYREQVRANQKAERRFGLAMAAIEQYYAGASQDLLLKQPQFAVLRKQLLGTPREFYQKLSAELEQEADRGPEAQAELARAYFGLAMLCASLGEKEEALGALTQARDVNEARHRSRPGDLSARSDLARSLGYLGDLYLEGGALSQAEDCYRKSHEIREALCRENPGDIDLRFQFARSSRNFGRLFRAQGRTDDALGSYQEARRIEADLVVRHPSVSRHLFDLARTCENIGWLYRESGRLEACVPALRDALEKYRRLDHQSPGDRSYMDGLASCQTALGIALREAGEADQARRSAEDAEGTLDRIGAEVMVAEFQHHRALNLQNLGYLNLAAGRVAQAQDCFNRAVAIQLQLVHGDAAHLEYRHDLGMMYEGLGQVLSRDGKQRESLEQFGQAIESLGAAVVGNPRILYFRRSLARADGELEVASRTLAPAVEQAAVFVRVAGVLAACSASTAAIENESASHAATESRLFADRAVASLRSAIAVGFRDLDQIRRDTRFDALRSREDLRALLGSDTKQSSMAGPEAG